jgi:hypothetical protein
MSGRESKAERRAETLSTVHRGRELQGKVTKIFLDMYTHLDDLRCRGLMSANDEKITEWNSGGERSTVRCQHQ